MKKKHPRHGRIHDVTVSLDDTRPLIAFLKGIGGSGSISEQISTVISKGLRPFSMDLDPSSYSDPDLFRSDYLLSEILSKFDDEKSSQIKKDLAIEKFLHSETRCALTNNSLQRPSDLPLINGISVSSVLYVASRKIERLLGEFSWDAAERGFDFGPGATTRLRRARSMPLYKFSGKPEVTSNCADLGRTALRYYRLWEEAVLNDLDSPDTVTVCEGNRIVTVPKNAKIDRVIAIEPDLNIFIQKGIGRLIRTSLQKVGVNLNDQTRNQRLARIGSIDGSLATIDLRSASDTVSRMIVELLLPPDWLLALEQCRSPKGVLPSGKIIRYQKFSSMGNGYTFELQSLIFWALQLSVCELLGLKDIVCGVYGDDLICPVEAAETLIGLLRLVGFDTNEKKTFTEGPFRESCGKHYFMGHDVTPFYIRHQPRRLSHVFLLHNNVLRWCGAWGTRGYLSSGSDGSSREYCEYLRGSVPLSWRRPRLPDGYGDGGFIGSFDSVLPQRAPRGFEGFSVRALHERSLGRIRNEYGTLQSPLAASLWRGYRASGRSGGAFLERPTSPQCGSLVPRWCESISRGKVPPSLLHLFCESGTFGDRGGSFDFKGIGEARRESNASRSCIVKMLVPRWVDLDPWL